MLKRALVIIAVVCTTSFAFGKSYQLALTENRAFETDALNIYCGELDNVDCLRNLEGLKPHLHKLIILSEKLNAREGDRVNFSLDVILSLKTVKTKEKSDSKMKEVASYMSDQMKVLLKL